MASTDNGTDGKRDRRWMSAAYGIWALLFAVFTVAVLLDPDHKLVFKIFSNAARAWWSDTSIYAPHATLDVYRYSPTFAVLLSPLAIFSDPVAVVLWNALSLGVLFASLRVLVRDLLPGEWPRWREGLFLFLSVVGTVRGVWSGQSNALVLGCAILAAAAVLRKRWWLAAFLLAGPVFVKMWPIALFLLLAALRPRELIGRFFAACGALAAIPFLTRAPAVVLSEYAAFVDTLLRTSTVRWQGFRDGRTLLELFVEVNDTLYTGLQLASAAAVLAWCLWQRRRGLPQRHLLTLVLAAWVGWQLLIGPGTERLTYGVIAPFATWAVLRSYRESRHRFLTTAAWLMTGILGSGNVERRLIEQFPAALAILPAGVVLYLLWLLVWGARPVEARPAPAGADGS